MTAMPMLDPTTARAEQIREQTGCSWEHACARAERERAEPAHTNEDYGRLYRTTQWMPVYVYSYAWNRDYTALVRSRRFSVGYDLETGESVPF